jgi:uncharacterized protein (DUF2147 family)
MAKMNLQEEIRRITNELAAGAEKKALEVSTQAMLKASEVADLAKVRAAEVSSMAIAKALDASTLAAEKAAAAAAAAASVATATNLDLTYIKKDIADTKADIKSINEKLDNKYTSKEEFRTTRDLVNKLDAELKDLKQFQSTSLGNIRGMRDVGTWVFSGIMALVTIASVLFAIFKP